MALVGLGVGTGLCGFASNGAELVIARSATGFFGGF